MAHVCTQTPHHHSSPPKKVEREIPNTHTHTCTHTHTHTQGMDVTLRNSVKLMEASTPPELFNSGEQCQMLIKAAASEYMCRDELYGRCLGIQVSTCFWHDWIGEPQ